MSRSTRARQRLEDVDSQPVMHPDGVPARLASKEIQEKLSHGGTSLGLETKEQMQAFLGHDLSDVRIHADPATSSFARKIGAAAFTIGTDIGFASGRYRPDSPAGGRLLAHELVHVLQHASTPKAARSEPLRISQPQDRHEHQSRRIAAGFQLGDAPNEQISTLPQLVVSRETDTTVGSDPSIVGGGHSSQFEDFPGNPYLAPQPRSDNHRPPWSVQSGPGPPWPQQNIPTPEAWAWALGERSGYWSEDIWGKYKSSYPYQFFTTSYGRYWYWNYNSSRVLPNVARAQMLNAGAGSLYPILIDYLDELGVSESLLDELAESDYFADVSASASIDARIAATNALGAELHVDLDTILMEAMINNLENAEFEISECNNRLKIMTFRVEARDLRLRGEQLEADVQRKIVAARALLETGKAYATRDVVGGVSVILDLIKESGYSREGARLIEQADSLVKRANDLELATIGERYQQALGNLEHADSQMLQLSRNADSARSLLASKRSLAEQKFDDDSAGSFRFAELHRERAWLDHTLEFAQSLFQQSFAAQQSAISLIPQDGDLSEIGNAQISAEMADDASHWIRGSFAAIGHVSVLRARATAIHDSAWEALTTASTQPSKDPIERPSGRSND